MHFKILKKTIFILTLPMLFCCSSESKENNKRKVINLKDSIVFFCTFNLNKKDNFSTKCSRLSILVTLEDRNNLHLTIKNNDWWQTFMTFTIVDTVLRLNNKLNTELFYDDIDISLIDLNYDGIFEFLLKYSDFKSINSQNIIPKKHNLFFSLDTSENIFRIVKNNLEDISRYNFFEWRGEGYFVEIDDSDNDTLKANLARWYPNEIKTTYRILLYHEYGIPFGINSRLETKTRFKATLQEMINNKFISKKTISIDTKKSPEYNELIYSTFQGQNYPMHLQENIMKLISSNFTD